MPFKPAHFAPVILAISLAGCDQPSTISAEQADPQTAFWDRLSSQCGKAFHGTLVSDDAADASLADAAMVMHVRECSDDRIAVPFHIGTTDETGAIEWNRSRTWLITKTDAGLRLKHDHRHADGAADTVTFYGGDTQDNGMDGAQNFPVDAKSIAMFQQHNLDASITNIWTVEVDAADSADPQFTYQLKRTVEGGAPEDRLFRVEFDLSVEMPTPPAPWGHE
ncbi:MAG: hypothetical protein ABJO41_10710 [Erythrobacter sp.]